MEEEPREQLNIVEEVEEEKGKEDVKEKESELSEEKLSKKQLKKQNKKEIWHQKKLLKRKIEKEKRKGKKRDFSRNFLKNKKMSESDCKINIVIDLSFDDLMIEKDLGKCIKQVGRCYSINRRLPSPIQLHCTSFEGESKKVLEKNAGYSSWDIKFHSEPYETIFEKNKLVYLTSESENTIEELEEDKIYIIGGLVDHNSQKGLCYKIAQEKGIMHAKLPIDKYVDMKERRVLTIDHVFEIMANKANGSSWEETLLKVIPTRKNVVPKEKEKM